MFDLKAKLLKIGLVTKEQVEKAEQEKNNIKQKKKRSSKPVSFGGDFAAQERARSLNNLKSLKKPEQYIIIRKWVEINRLDKSSHSTIDCEKFFLPSLDNQVSWITIKKEVIEEIKSGNAGVVSYVSNHGRSHAVVPRDIAEDIAEVFPDWLKVLNEKMVESL